jgi:hypothetical protein
MTSTAALENLLLNHAIHDSVRELADGCEIAAETRADFSCYGDASDAAYALLKELLDLGYRLRGGLVGAERTADGAWRGELVEIYLAPAA